MSNSSGADGHACSQRSAAPPHARPSSSSIGGAEGGGAPQVRPAGVCLPALLTPFLHFSLKPSCLFCFGNNRHVAKKRVEQTRSRVGEIHLRHGIEGRFHLRHILKMINRVFRRGIQLDAAPESWFTWTVRRLRLSSTGEPAPLPAMVVLVRGSLGREKCDGGGGRQEGARNLEGKCCDPADC